MIFYMGTPTHFAITCFANGMYESEYNINAITSPTVQMIAGRNFF